MDECPEPGELPAGAGQALGRLLSHENQISDLIAFLAALDSEPFLAVLGLPGTHCFVEPEELLGNSSGRADLVVRDESGPIALLEIKVGATQHGDQFARYGTWAKAQAPPARCYLIGLDERPLDAPADWTVAFTLPVLLRRWQDSKNPHAAWLATAAAAVLEGWVTQVEGKIGRATSPIVADLVTRRIAADLVAGWPPGADFEARATRTNGGTAMVLAWLPFPGKPRDLGAWLCLDFRSMVRDHPAAPWVLRLGVEVEINDQITVAEAKATAHDLAISLLVALRCTAVQQAFQQGGQDDLAAVLRPRGRTRDGLRSTPDDVALDEWRANALAAKAATKHPVLAHDNLGSGFRLASLIEVNVVDLDRHQLVTLLRSALRHLEGHARTRWSVQGD